MRLSFSGLARLKSGLKNLVSGIAERVNMVPIRAADSTEERAIRVIGRVANLNAAKIKEHIERKDGGGKAKVLFSRKAISVKHYGAKKLRRTPPRTLRRGEDPLPGVSFRIWRTGQIDEPRGSFHANYRGHEFWKRTREGDKYRGTLRPRVPIKPLIGSAISTVIRKNINILDKLEKYAGERVLVEAVSIVDAKIEQL